MCLLYRSDNRPWKAYTLQIAWDGIEGCGEVPKVVHFGLLRGLVLGAILQSFIYLSIHGVGSSFFAQIEAGILR